jgi:fucose 4-O-acetylase-like acetyltransferase
MDWEVKNKETFLEPTIFVMFISFWIMPLFFMLAGIGTRFALKTKTTIQYIKDRYWRLVVPYLFGIFILIPPQRYVESLSKGKFSGTFFDFLSWYPEHKLLIGNFGFSPVWFGEPGTHLWFLAFLFVFSILAVPVEKQKRRKAYQASGDSERKDGRHISFCSTTCLCEDRIAADLSQVFIMG